MNIHLCFKSIFKCTTNLLKYFFIFFASLIFSIALQEKLAFNDDIGFSLALLISTFFFLLALKIEKKKPIEFLRLRKVNFKLLPSLIFLSVIILLFEIGLGNLLHEIFTSPISDDMDLCFFSVLHILILAPICEEIFFRGIIFAKLKNIMPLSLAIFIQAFLFGFLHGGLSGHIIQALIITISGIVLGLVYHYTENLSMSISFHFINNFIVMILNILDFDINPIFCILISILLLIIYIKWITSIKY
ncbi:type II CAAX endopeptidase family protein [Clostridium chauvoei]|uniref:CAAX prenyl protease 2/Lysostaphin resistance protein A-like domain-containing protein n=2 Tax=Clostridium chauvoei TaxID=46867 RepID=A0A1U6J0J3_9CLOT|nr:type II CAAX endopeptidase family protein [Clostridium chauvoei]ATD54337.1 hypothetical protein BTM20_03440 [Clostridium chauvoei]ATD57979.1 hypothetical protein BTM21_09620 [Clostridium chauvoei]MBX7279775.1 CPBP family intramembrane metalloprotease [Clostridium chauvoei]MBX7282144.1 CPBP family intramembrane metalloprotease [Clostridium chauvoei]MBX7284666.1 CPBP family intramembrane metalloprotease [Clostridium chauvoei]